MDYWGGPKGMLAPPLKLLGGGGLAPPGPHSSYAYVLYSLIIHSSMKLFSQRSRQFILSFFQVFEA